MNASTGLRCKIALCKHTTGGVKFDVTVAGESFLIFCDFKDYPEVKRRLFEQWEREFDSDEAAC